METNSTSDAEKTTYFTNKEFFLPWEKYGYGVVKKAYKDALVQNMMRAGGTYINSALTKVIVADGV